MADKRGRGASCRVEFASATFGTIGAMTAKQQLLERAPRWTEAQAIAALRVVESQSELVEYFEAEARMSPNELKQREDRQAEANAREVIREERWPA